MANSELDGSRRSLAAELLVTIADNEDGAMEALVDLATEEPSTQWMLDVILELEIGEAERSDGLPQPSAAVAARLEEFVRVMVQAHP